MQVGGGSPFVYRLEEMQKKRFCLGVMHTNTTTQVGLSKPSEAGIAAGAGEGAEGCARNSTSKLNATDKEEGVGGDRGTTVTHNN